MDTHRSVGKQATDFIAASRCTARPLMRKTQSPESGLADLRNVQDKLVSISRLQFVNHLQDVSRRTDCYPSFGGVIPLSHCRDDRIKITGVVPNRCENP